MELRSCQRAGVQGEKHPLHPANRLARYVGVNGALRRMLIRSVLACGCAPLRLARPPLTPIPREFSFATGKVVLRHRWPAQAPRAFYERDNRGKVNLYFCPDDSRLRLVQTLRRREIPTSGTSEPSVAAAKRPLSFRWRPNTFRRRRTCRRVASGAGLPSLSPISNRLGRYTTEKAT